MATKHETKFIKDVFWDIPLSEYDIDFYASRINDILEILEDRDMCLIKRRLNGDSFKKAGLELFNLSSTIVKADHYFNGVRVKKPCEGVTACRANQMYFKILRQLRHKRVYKVWTGEMSGNDYVKKRLGLSQSR